MDIPENWTFKNSSVAAGFDDHVREQLPWYNIATGMVAHFIRHYLSEGGLVYDIGASTGNIGRSVEATLKARHATLVPIEASSEMGALYTGPGRLVISDAMAVDYQPFDVAVLFLVLMFMPASQRLDLLRKLVSRVKPGGCVIVFDKVHDASLSGYSRVAIHRLTLAGKVAANVPPKDIIDKELSLAGSQRPLDLAVLREEFPDAIDVFRFGEFVGWVIESRVKTL